MSSIPIRCSLTTTALASLNRIVLAFIGDLRRRGEIAERTVPHYRYCARHFLVWLELSGIALETLDGTAIDRFLQHDCYCCASAPASARLRPWRKRRSSPQIMKLVRFLEREGKIKTPGDLNDNLRILDRFLEGLRGAGYAPRTIRKFRNGCACLIAWLHLSRVSLCDLNPHVYARFRKSRFHGSVPGVYDCRRALCPKISYKSALRQFLRHLVATGGIASTGWEPPENALPEQLGRFRAWLDHNRGICETTLCNYTRMIMMVLPALGEDPRGYDAELIRRVLSAHMENRSQAYVHLLILSMRMYLRFLASEGSVAAALVWALPTVPQWRLSTLPRYIPANDVERTVASCGDGSAGVRDRAILLLLARLALRAGEVVALRLDDIDWDRAKVRIPGKSRRQTALPLPQDVGDALYAYITTARPKVDEAQVFLRSRAPHRPFARGTVTAIARSALDRAGIVTFATRGAHVFRHSQATSLLRSGSSLDVVQALLRHASPNTTMIYAKTDAVMLGEITQPWIGGMGE